MAIMIRAIAYYFFSILFFIALVITGPIWFRGVEAIRINNKRHAAWQILIKNPEDHIVIEHTAHVVATTMFFMAESNLPECYK